MGEKKVDIGEIVLKVKNRAADCKPFIKKAALPVVAILALLVFWVYGREEPVTVTEENVPGAEQSVAQSGVGGEDADGGAGGQSGMAQGGAGAGDGQVESEGGQSIFVDIGGDVRNPGVYEVPAGTRLFQVIERAGGLLESADTDGINQAEAVTDGQKILVASRDADSPYYSGEGGGLAIAGGTAGAAQGAVRMDADGNPIVNINLATEEELQQIPGVGPATAKKIVDYRTEHGSFARKEDLMHVSGIGEKTFAAMADMLEV